MLKEILEALRKENDSLIQLKPYEEEYSCRLEDPKQFDSFARKNCFRKISGKCLDYIFGIKDGKSKIQSFRYKKSVWSKSSARSHCQKMKGSFGA